MKFKICWSNMATKGIIGAALLFSILSNAQGKDPIIEAIVKEANENSHLQQYAFELIDVIGPRLVGTPQMMQAHNWVVDQYQDLGLQARNEQYGTWKGWERGTTSVTMLSPRIKSLEATQLAWSPATAKNGVSGEVVILKEVDNPEQFEQWLKTIKGKFVMISLSHESGRPEHQWKEYATPESYQKMKETKKQTIQDWNKRIENTGYTAKELPLVLEKAGAAGIVMSYWTGIVGANRIFSAVSEKVPTIDISNEDYGLLYRLAQNGKAPTINVNVQSKDLGEVPTFNSIAEFKGTKYPDQYVVLSAHLDSWDGGTGATDNGTGVITMMEVVRILKKVLPNPKRTILVGNWGSEEQGLNGSRAFVEDNKEILPNIQVLLNQDAGTGRIDYLPGEGFLHSYSFISDWLSGVPQEHKQALQTNFPATPSEGGSDHAAFVSEDVPAFFLNSTEWGYSDYTWHTNRDTYDKIVFDDVKSNAILIAIMAYKASEQEEQTSREKIKLPTDEHGNKKTWPTSKGPKRTYK